MENVLRNIVLNLKNNPRDLKTVPLKGEGKWFYAYEDKGDIYVDSAIEHNPSCSIAIRRKLQQKEFELIYKIYLRRENGEQVSQEATEVTRNQVYWYSIIKNCSKYIDTFKNEDK